MGLLDFEDTYKPPFTSRKFERIEDNLEELNNLGYKKVSEDYSDEIERLN